MKKQNNILAYTKQALSLALTSILFFACQDDEIIKNSTVEEGIPVEVEFSLSATEMTTAVTRGLRDEEEFQINDLYLLIFDSKGERKKGTHYYDSEELLAYNHNGSQNKPTYGEILKIHTTSGKSYIFAAANVSNNQLNGENNIKKQLDAVSNIEQFKAITAMLNSKTDAAQVERTQAALVMCGAYTPNQPGTTEAEGECIIPAKNSAITNGKIILERLDSHITFNITWGATDSKVTSFELTGWRVYNVPVKSYLFAQDKDAVGDSENHYATSPSVFKATTDRENNTCSFDFYMLENRKNAKIVADDGSRLESYAAREAEEKNDDGTNTGIYKYVEPHATYVEIKANMELLSSNDKNGKKIANVTYVIHLGGDSNDFTNFQSKRNTKYTYNISIKDTEDIRVEVQEKEERRPGVEGDVIDAETKVYTLDSHYSCFILGLTKQETKNMSFIVKTPFATVTNESNESERELGDYKWIRFAPCTSNKLALYPANGEGLIDLFGLSEHIQSQNGADDKTFYYTVFVDEYYYNKPPKGQNWNKPYWQYFVNKENRYAILLFAPLYSADKESSYADAQYLITQRSIQTYYSTTNFNKDQTALGLEHVNETGVPPNNAPTGSFNTSNGFYNMYYKFIVEKDIKNWSKDHADMTEPNTNGYTFKITRNSGWSHCLSRNRDENGNGIIDPEEVKWYLPARDQLSGMYLGAESLITPLFNADAHPEKVISGDTRYHFLLSNDQKLWAEEGASLGARTAGNGSPKELRCVRNLNLDMNSSNAQDINSKVSNVFTYDETTRVFNLEKMDSKNVRGKVDSGELGLHHNFSITNRPYKAFQVAKDFLKASNGKWASQVKINDLNESKCHTYSEKLDKSDKGKWRTPNQREFMIMYMQSADFVRYFKDHKNYVRAYTRTEWKYNANRHFGYNEGILFLDSGQSFDIALRCVRDVDVDANGNIIDKID